MIQKLVFMHAWCIYNIVRHFFELLVVFAAPDFDFDLDLEDDEDFDFGLSLLTTWGL